MCCICLFKFVIITLHYITLRRAMNFRLDLCIIVQKNTVICCINCVALSFYTHFYSCIFQPLHYRADISTPAFSTPCFFLLFRADISTPAFSTPAFSVPPSRKRYKIGRRITHRRRKEVWDGGKTTGVWGTGVPQRGPGAEPR